MKKMLIFVTILLISTFLFPAESKEYGFTGRIVIETIPIPANQFDVQDFEVSESNQALSGKVRVLSIGAKKSKIFNPVRPNYNLYDYYYLTYDEWWVGAVLINYDRVDHEVTLTMTVKGRKTTEITKQLTIKANSVKAVTASFNPFPWPGLYLLTGLVEGATIVSNKVNTRLYIYDAF